MNLVGKIFTVLILVMSIFFGAFTVLVYATHKNWKLVVDNPNPMPGQDLGYKQRLDNERKSNEDLTAEKEQRERELEAEKKAKEEAVKKLENEKATLKGERDDLQKERDDLILNQREITATLKVTQEECQALRIESTTLRADIKQAQQDRDAHFKEVVKLTDLWHQQVNEVKRLQQINLKMAGDFAKAKEVLRLFGLVAEPSLYIKDAQGNGVVLGVSNGGNLVEISIGSDDRVLEGHKFQVVRVGGGVNKYVGKIQVVETRPDKAVCKVLKEFLQSPVQKGDRVFAKLQPPKNPITGS